MEKRDGSYAILKLKKGYFTFFKFNIFYELHDIQATKNVYMNFLQEIFKEY